MHCDPSDLSLTFDLQPLQVFLHLWLLRSSLWRLVYFTPQTTESLHLEAIASQSHYQITRLKTHTRCC